MNPSVPPVPAAYTESSLNDYIHILSRRKWWVIGFCVVGTLLVAFLSLSMTPLYKASATLIIEGEDANILGVESGSSKGVSFDIFENYLETQMAIIQSRQIAGRVYEEMRLYETPYYASRERLSERLFGPVLDGVRSWMGPQEPGDPKMTGLKLFLEDIELERMQGTRAVRLSVYNPDPVLAADISNRLATTYATSNLERRAVSFVQNQRMAQLNAEFLSLQSQYDELSKRYGPKHPTMIRLRQEIQTLSERLQDSRNDQKILAQETISDVDGASNEAMIQKVLSEIQEESVMSSSRVNNINVADPAFVPQEPAKPNVARNILVSFFGSLVLGIFYAFFLEFLDDRVKSEHDLKKVLGEREFLGAIPKDSHNAGFKKISKIDSLFARQPMSEIAEAYRVVRTAMYWMANREGGVKDLAIMSSIPGEGKTTVASNMAIAIAKMNQRVLLVDADIRRGRLHKTYHQTKTNGLTEVLTGKMRWEEAVHETQIPNLELLPGGEVVHYAAELFASQRMKEFLEAVRAKYDVILYDTAPLLVMSDALILADQLSGGILVVKADVTRKSLVSRSLAKIEKSNVRLFGAVLNYAPFADEKSYYKYYNVSGKI